MFPFLKLSTELLIFQAVDITWITVRISRYHKAYREFLKARYLLVNKPRPTAQDKEKLLEMERDLRKLRTQPNMKREVTVALSTKEFYNTGLYCDVVQVKSLSVFIPWTMGR